MKPISLFIFIGIVLAIIIIVGCHSTKYITTRTELWSPEETGPITVLTKDSLLYKLNVYSLADSMLAGKGVMQKNEISSLFQGDIKLSNIRYIYSINTSFLKTIVAIGGIAAVGSIAISNLSKTEGASVTEQIGYYSPSSGSGSSCPYIYSWAGDRFILDAEAFGIAFGKSLELSTSSVLPSLKSDNNLLKIKIANERPETHHINKIELMGVEADINASVYLDEFNNAWCTYNPIKPISANDNLGIDILEKTISVDTKYWESNNIPTVTSSNFDDITEFNFINQQKAASIILTAINTEFSQVVFKNVFDFLGDQSLAFVQSVENDPEMIAALKKWIVESSLKVSVWNGREWNQISSLHPEATAVPFSRIVRINGDDIHSDTIKVKLTCLADVWKIDGIQIDWMPTQQLKQKSVKRISAIGPNQADFSSQIANSDEKYAVLLPPESIELNYEAIKPASNKKMVYIINAQGYLHEWFPPKNSPQSNLSNISIPATQRIDYLKSLLQNKSIFLPPIYSQWEQTKTVINKN